MSEPTEAQRIDAGLRAIEQISADLQSTDPEYFFKNIVKPKDLDRAVCDIYKIAHTLRNPDCRKNHPEWIKLIDEGVK